MTVEERTAFLEAAGKAERRVRTLCTVLAYTGCRLSEALELTPRRVDLSELSLRFRSLKKRKDKNGRPKLIYRTVPVPPAVIEQLDLVYGIREIQRRGDAAELDVRIWSWKRCWTWNLAKQVMDVAEIQDGPHKTAKGLRHSYGVAAMKAGIQLNMLQKWMGHADLKTTAIYANALGEEERAIAARMWS
ncbi:MAG: site-specific integrase [Cyanobacteria bacterium P01_D01_bin.44]